jgi:hypothetical protein
MDNTIGNIPSATENDTSTPRQKPISAKQLAANQRNAKLGGRPKRSGVLLVDWAKYQRLGLDGRSDKEIAGILGVSVRTFKRRKAERQLAERQLEDELGF